MPGGSLMLKPMLTCVNRGLSNGPMSLKHMVVELHTLFWVFLFMHVNMLTCKWPPLGTHAMQKQVSRSLPLSNQMKAWLGKPSTSPAKPSYYVMTRKKWSDGLFLCDMAFIFHASISMVTPVTDCIKYETYIPADLCHFLCSTKSA